MDRGAWQVTVRRVAKSWAQLKRLSTHAGGLLSRQLQQPLCQMASLCSSTSSLYTSPFYSVPTKDAPTCLLASSCVWPTEIIGRRWERGRVKQRFLCYPPQLSPAPPTKSLSSSPHRMLPAQVLITTHSSEGPTPWPHLNAPSSSVPTDTVNFISTGL